jgi:hypothetical protein
VRIQFGDPINDGNGHWIVNRTIIHDDGTEENGIHAFPLDAMEWRAAEYDIDPADTQTLLDIILMEPYLLDSDMDGAQLYDGVSSLDKVREDHLARCARVKLRHRVSTRGSANNALKIVRENSDMDLEAIKIKSEMVGNRRKRATERTQPENRIAELKKAARQVRSERSE